MPSIPGSGSLRRGDASFAFVFAADIIDAGAAIRLFIGSSICVAFHFIGADPEAIICPVGVCYTCGCFWAIIVAFAIGNAAVSAFESETLVLVVGVAVVVTGATCSNSKSIGFSVVVSACEEGKETDQYKV